MATMRRSFLRALGVAPEYRRRFQDGSARARAAA
ncbi:MAG: hypothetical protein JWO23_1742 [Solirubrobacterales bacterium]|jgi:hypothetical protein|nr:hypothetical protein [Solirubrobacterales bacterium]